MLKWPGHQAISASAGTGKTYRLAHRFVQLVMYGEAPERIIALTFSRKAAGEIFDRVVALFILASSSEEEARAMNDRIAFPEGTRDTYRAALRNLLETLPRSRVGTIDSFTVGIVRSFPYELGLDPDFRVFDMEGLDARHYRRQALRHVLEGASATEDERKAFLKAYKDATFGHEEKQAAAILEQLVKDYQQLYRLQPQAAKWGLRTEDEPTVTPDTLPARLDRFLDAVETLSLPTTPHKYFNEFADELRVWGPESSAPRRIKYMLERLEPHFTELGSRAVTVKFGRDSVTLDEVIGGMLRELLVYIVGNVLRLANYRTAGLYRVVERYEAAYDELVRLRGFLTFDDALYSLTGHRLVSGDASGADSGTKLAINYRLDGRLDHWLLDEFQDTSTMQWQVLSSLIDEVVQDNEQRRTFFYVGDIKQAIYAWRGGNAGLFGQILDHYNRAGAAIDLQFSNVSFRSAPPIIDTVNRVFGALPAEFSEDAVARWNASWQEHACCPAKKDAAGYVALAELERGEVDGVDENTRRLQAAAGIVADIDPVRRGLTAAILTRDNHSAWEVAELMRAEYPDIPVALEGKSRIADNPAVCLLLSLLHWASHPGDLFALRHVQMSPLADAVRDPAARAALPVRIAADIQGRGFLRTLRDWVERLERAQSVSPYEAMRIQQLLDLASTADREPDRDIDRFVEMVREAAIEDAASRQSVRVMTIHKSKGLDFDVVVLPNLQGRGGGGTRTLVQWNDDRSEPDWILQHVSRDYANFDARLKTCIAEAEVQDKYEELCVLYVAMTRAAKALYLVTTELPERSTARSHAMILQRTIGGSGGGSAVYGGLPVKLAYESGDSAWYQSEAVQGDVDEPEPGAPEKLEFRLKPDDRFMPSSGGEFERSAGQLFAASLVESREFGSAVHAVFEGIEWLDEESLPTDDPENQAAVEHVRACLQSSEIRALFMRRDEHCEVWREQAFEVILGPEWVSGVFDRVVVCRDDAGNPLRADIIDFKTNRIRDDEHLDETVAHYRSQMETYRKALAVLLGIKSSEISAHLVFTSVARVAQV